MQAATLSRHPVLIVGAGPIGLAAAAKCARRGIEFLVLEAGSEPAWAVRQWQHVRLFSPWEDCFDADAAALLQELNWPIPDRKSYPTGAELIERYLAPLAGHPAIRARLRLNMDVVRYGRCGLDKYSARMRFEMPFIASTAQGEAVPGRALIDASGNWRTPLRLMQAECTSADRIRYGIPDLGSAADHGLVQGKRVLVIGAGHSGMTTILDLAAHNGPERIIWVRRSVSVPGAKVYPEGSGRAALEARAEAAAASGRIETIAGASVSSLRETGFCVTAAGTGPDGRPWAIEADVAFVATGFRPDHSLSDDLWTATDHRWEAPAGLAPLIDPEKHSCNTVPAHGVAELSHPERDFFIVGAKSYGRAPNFALTAGYAQLDSVTEWLQPDRGRRTIAAPAVPAPACRPCP